MKRCSGCNRLLEAIAGTSFNRKDGTTDGLQPWCRECDFNQKGDEKHGWKNFQRRLLETKEAHLWCRDEYERVMSLAPEGAYHCWSCGAFCPRWSQGYWVDRIDNDRGYAPDNCLPCCKGCNFVKSDNHPSAAKAVIDTHVSTYGRGRVPWAKLNMRVREQKAPDLSPYVVEDPQLGLFAEPKKRRAN